MTAVLVAAAVIISAKKKNWGKLKRFVFPMFTLYLCAVLGITVFNRLPFDNFKYNLELFWSYKGAAESKKLLWEIILNYFLLLPYGLLAPLYMKKRWVLLSGFVISALVETAQFLMKRGLFEFDDIVGNTLGVVIGIGIYTLIRHVWELHRSC